MASAPIDGFCEPRFARVRDAFAENFDKHHELGAGVALVMDGRPVVDLWGGYANEERSRLWQRDTLVNVFSVGKGIASLCLLMLVDRGLVDLDAPVARYWPEFAQAGKENVTVRQMLSHQAGLPAVREVLPEGAMLDWQWMATALARQEPWWTPGTRHGYHVNTFGFLVGEVLRRVDGRTIGTFLREELAEPFGADFHIGLPLEHHARVAEFSWLSELATIPDIDRRTLTDEQLMNLHTYFNPAGASGHRVVNDTAWRLAEYPSTNGHGTALGVAELYGVVASGGEVGGRRFIGREILAEASREHSVGIDVILGRPSRFGLGFQLSPLERPIGPNAGVVLHFGAGGALGFADPVARIGFGYVMNRMGPRYHNPTNRNLIGAVYACL